MNDTISSPSINNVSEWSVTTRFGIPLFINVNPNGLEQFKDGCSLDVETDEKDNFVGIGIFNGKECFYWSDWEFVKQIAVPRFLAHNGKYDLQMLRKWGFNVDASYLLNDTIIASYVMDITSESHSLKSYAAQLCMPYPKYSDIVGSGKRRITLDKQPLELVAEYNACDCVATWKLWEKQQKEMTPKQMKYYQDVEMPIYRTLYKMQELGVKLDVKFLETLRIRYTTESEQLVQGFRRLLGKEFNPNSTKQLKTAIKDRFGIDLESTNKETLQKRKSIPFIASLLRYKKVNKLVSTYIKPYLNGTDELHPEFNQVSYDSTTKEDVGMRTPRLSSRNPNFMNLPSHSEEGLLIRQSILPHSGNIFVLADYSQADLRMLAHFSEDKLLMKSFNNREDVHKDTAVAMGWKPDEVVAGGKTARDLAKTINFATIYGSGAWNLANKLNISFDSANKFLKKFESIHPEIYDWKQKTLYNAQKEGYVRTLLGLDIKWELWPNCKRHGLKKDNKGLPCPDSCKERLIQEANRRAISAIVQGSVGEMIKLAMIQIDKRGYKYAIQEHDALLFEIVSPNSTFNILSTQCNEIKQIMENVVKLKVPIEVSIHSGYNWAEAKE